MTSEREELQACCKRLFLALCDCRWAVQHGMPIPGNRYIGRREWADVLLHAKRAITQSTHVLTE